MVHVTYYVTLYIIVYFTIAAVCYLAVLILSLVGGCSLYSLGILTGREGRVVLHNGHQTLEEGAGGGGRRGEGGGR